MNIQVRLLVSADGLILTNRHIAEPWWEMETSPYIQLGINYKAEIVRYSGHFSPGIKEPFPLKVENF